jgi:hypothetical protein
VDHLKEPSSRPLVQGSSYHEALKDNFQYKITTGQDLKFEEVEQKYYTSWDNNVKISKEADERIGVPRPIPWNDLESLRIKTEGLNLLRKYYTDFAQSIIPVAAEKKYELDINGVNFIGYIDLERENELVDYKLRKNPITQEEANKLLQPLSYGMLNGKLNFAYHVGVKRLPPEIFIVRVQKTKEDIEKYRELIIKMIDEINTGAFKPNLEHQYCNPRGCYYWHKCRIEKK